MLQTLPNIHTPLIRQIFRNMKSRISLFSLGKPNLRRQARLPLRFAAPCRGGNGGTVFERVLPRLDCAYRSNSLEPGLLPTRSVTSDTRWPPLGVKRTPRWHLSKQRSSTYEMEASPVDRRETTTDRAPDRRRTRREDLISAARSSIGACVSAKHITPMSSGAVYHDGRSSRASHRIGARS